MDYNSPGGRLRLKRTQDPEESLVTASERLGIDKDALSLIERGKRLPSLSLAAKIEQEYGLLASSWILYDVGRRAHLTDKDLAESIDKKWKAKDSDA